MNWINSAMTSASIALIRYSFPSVGPTEVTADEFLSTGATDCNAAHSAVVLLPNAVCVSIEYFVQAFAPAGCPTVVMRSSLTPSLASAECTSSGVTGRV